MQRWIMHIDMDAFFTSVEQHDDPSLKGLPVIVGGGARGVVAASSYEARKYGVRSAMPMFQARRLCPQGVYLRGRRARYSEVSRRIMDILSGFSPVIEKASIDEAYLDATGLQRVFGPVDSMAEDIKKAVKEATGLTCSVGLAPVKFLAKIASDLQKPDGLTVIRPDEVQGFLASLPIASIPGLGKKTLPDVHRLGVRYAGEVAAYPRDFWVRRFGKFGGLLFDRASGIDGREVVPFEPPKSESAENTFEHDVDDREVLRTWLLRQAERVGRSLRKQDLAGRTVTLKVKYADFTTVTRARTLGVRINATRTIYETAVGLLEELNPRRKLRLIGVGVSHFEDHAVPARQLSLFADDDNPDRPGADPPTQAGVDAVMDAVADRFGPGSLTRGKLLAPRPKAAGQKPPGHGLE